jgi:hypothetical protein
MASTEASMVHIEVGITDHFLQIRCRTLPLRLRMLYRPRRVGLSIAHSCPYTRYFNCSHQRPRYLHYRSESDALEAIGAEITPFSRQSSVNTREVAKTQGQQRPTFDVWV